MKKALMNNRPIQKWLLVPALLFLAGLLLSSPAAGQDRNAQKLADLETRISAYTVQPGFPDDPYGLIVVNAALEAIKGESGGIGACLVDSRTGQVVETGRNRQFTTYFRSDLHAEMDLLNRYENRVKKLRSDGNGGNPRECPHLVLISSVEPCPMCLGAIYWARLDKLYFASDRKEAAEAGFSDEFIYDELGKNIRERSIPTRQMMQDNAKSVFTSWKDFENKIMY